MIEESNMKYCSNCAKTLEWRIPESDNQYRHVCLHCDTIYYNNPKIIVGTIPVWQREQILLCQRAIEPKSGFWTLPAGFMENNETTKEGAIRETIEEANATIKIRYLHTIYDIPRVNQVYLLFLADLQNLDFHSGAETLALKLFRKKDIDWDSIAFRSIRYCLQKFFSNKETNSELPPYHGSYNEE